MAGGDTGAFNERLLGARRPNFFELLAQEAMHEALRPAVEYVCKVVGHARPGLLGAVGRAADEVHLVVEALLQTFFIGKHGASFTESFYGLERVPLGSGRPQEGRLQLGLRQRLMSLLCLVALPYLKLKLDRLFVHLQEVDDASPLSWQRGEGLVAFARLLFFWLHPYLQVLWQGTNFIFRLRYLFGHTHCYSPALWLAGVALHRQMDWESGRSQPGAGIGWGRWLVEAALPLSVFFLKFLEWWYSGERSAIVKMMTSLPVPPSPRPVQPCPEGLRLPGNPQLCPICLQRRVDPTAVASSGYVFCYSCILAYQRRHGHCPVTRLPTSDRQLLRLYTQVNF